jgi:hypothetical protein
LRWPTLIAGELVLGVSSGQGGLGWFIFENRNLLDVPAVFAGPLTVIVIGLIVENLIFRTIERNTVLKWDLQSQSSPAPSGSSSSNRCRHDDQEEPGPVAQRTLVRPR